MSDTSFKVKKSAVLRPQTSAPSSPEDGEMYYNSSSNDMFVRINGSWVSVSTGLTPVVAARYTQNASVGITGGSAFNFADQVFDTDAAFSAGVYTAPSAGYYQYSTRVYINAAQFVLVYINGSAVGQGTNGDTAQPATYSDLHYLDAGDTIEVRPGNSGTASGGGTVNSFSIVKVR